MSFYGLYFWNKEVKHYKVYIVLLWIVNLLVIYQRVEAGCHSILQVIVGDLFGILLGILSYYQICNRFFPDKFPLKNKN